MDLFHAVILGVVEGLTEFLPVSSTGHLILAAHALGIPQTDFVKSFEVVIQLGAILAVVVLYGRTLLRDRAVLKRTLAAFLPTAVIGFILYKLIKTYLLGNVMLTVAMLAIGGALLILFERWQKGRAATVSSIAMLPYCSAILIGIAQSLAVVPGVSRSAATIVAGLVLGMSRAAVVEFSFLLAIPTMAAATGYDLLKSGFAFTPSEWTALAVGFIVSFVAALAAIRWFLTFVKDRGFAPFGWYRIAIAILFLLVLGL